MKISKLFAAALLAVAFSTSAFAGGPGGNTANEDFCATLTAVIKQAPTNFAAIQGEIDEAMTEEEEEDCFTSTQSLPGFERAVIVPGFTDTKKKIQFLNSYGSLEDAQAALAEIDASLKTCLTTAAGYKARVDSGIHLYESTTISLGLMTKEDYDDEGETIYLLLLQLYKK